MVNMFKKKRSKRKRNRKIYSPAMFVIAFDGTRRDIGFTRTTSPTQNGKLREELKKHPVFAGFCPFCNGHVGESDKGVCNGHLSPANPPGGAIRGIADPVNMARTHEKCEKKIGNDILYIKSIKTLRRYIAWLQKLLLDPELNLVVKSQAERNLRHYKGVEQIRREEELRSQLLARSAASR
jgi:hypothetical protein